MYNSAQASAKTTPALTTRPGERTLTCRLRYFGCEFTILLWKTRRRLSCKSDFNKSRLQAFAGLVCNCFSMAVVCSTINARLHSMPLN